MSRLDSRLHLSYLAIVGLCVVASVPALAAPAYNVHLVESIGDRNPRTSTAINEHGAVVVDVLCTDCLSRAFVNTTELIFPGDDISYGSDINDSGEVVGYSHRIGLNQPTHPFVYSAANGMQDLTSILGHPGIAFGINNLGDIVGIVESSPNNFRGFVLRNDVLTILDTNNSAKRINDSGLVAGDNYVVENGVMKPLLLPGGFYAYPLGINNQGQIVGYGDKDDPNSEHTVGAAFLYENGAITELVDLTSRSADPIGINNHGHIVGKAILGGKARAYIYRDDIFTDLNSLIDPNSGWVLELANDINDKGQIVGDGIFNGEFRVFRLDPIPEPSTFALLVGTMGMSFLRRRR